jgi:hypothetical protein
MMEQNFCQKTLMLTIIFHHFLFQLMLIHLNWPFSYLPCEHISHNSHSELIVLILL